MDVLQHSYNCMFACVVYLHLIIKINQVNVIMNWDFFSGFGPDMLVILRCKFVIINVIAFSHFKATAQIIFQFNSAEHNKVRMILSLKNVCDLQYQSQNTLFILLSSYKPPCLNYTHYIKHISYHVISYVKIQTI